MGFAQHKQVTRMTAHPTLNLKIETLFDLGQNDPRLVMMWLFSSHIQTHFLVASSSLCVHQQKTTCSNDGLFFLRSKVL